jgi:hypothetical protein
MFSVKQLASFRNRRQIPYRDTCLSKKFVESALFVMAIPEIVATDDRPDFDVAL